MIDGLVDLYTVLNAVQQHNETAIGYRIKTRGDQAMKQFDMTLNPTKSKGGASIKEHLTNIIAIEPNYAFEFSMIRIKGRDS